MKTTIGEDESNWIKANPNLHVSVKLDDLKRKAKKAKETPGALNAFLRLHMNLWTQAETRWIPVEKWRECGELEVIENEACRPSLLRGPGPFKHHRYHRVGLGFPACV